MKKVLIIDDCEQLRDTVAAILDDAGYGVESVDSPEQAMESCKSKKFDLVICDLVMPVAEDDFDQGNSSAMVGVRAIHEISRTNPGLPIIAISGELTGAPLEAIQSFGAVRCLSKPFGRDDLLNALEAAGV
jgi:CheY-like chemotaxis protein